MKKIVLILTCFLFIGKIFSQCSIIVVPNDTNLSNTAGLCGVEVNYVLPSILDTCSTNFFEDFENGAPGWQSGTLGVLDSWVIQNSSGTGYLFGSKMYGVPHSGNWLFGGAEYSFIQSPLFNTVGGGTISFDYYVNNEPAFHDMEIIKLSFDGGATWTQMLGDQLPNHGLNIQSINLNVTAIEGTVNTLIRFEYNTVDACCGAQDGFFIDNVKFEKDVIVQQISGLGSGAIFPIGTTTETYIFSSNGIVDTISFDVIVNSIYNHNQSFIICDGESISVGNNTYITTGNYIDTLVTTYGCDSVVSTDLIVKNEIDTSVTVSDYYISSNEDNATYQWVDVADNNAAINGEINQDFLFTEDGSYAVIINNEGCIKISQHVTVISTDVENDFKTLSYALDVFPNPTNGVVYIKTNDNFSNSNLSIIDMTGQEIYRAEDIRIIKYSVDLNSFASGIYYLKVFNNEETKIVRLIKE